MPLIPLLLDSATGVISGSFHLPFPRAKGHRRDQTQHNSADSLTAQTRNFWLGAVDRLNMKHRKWLQGKVICVWPLFTGRAESGQAEWVQLQKLHQKTDWAWGKSSCGHWVRLTSTVETAAMLSSPHAWGWSFCRGSNGCLWLNLGGLPCQKVPTQWSQSLISHGASLSHSHTHNFLFLNILFAGHLRKYSCLGYKDFELSSVTLGGPMETMENTREMITYTKLPT